MPPFRKPSNWDSLSAVDQAQYARKLRATDDKIHRLIDKMDPKLHPSLAEANKSELTKAVIALDAVERERFEAIIRERTFDPSKAPPAPLPRGYSQTQHETLVAQRKVMAEKLAAERRGGE